MRQQNASAPLSWASQVATLPVFAAKLDALKVPPVRTAADRLLSPTTIHAMAVVTDLLGDQKRWSFSELMDVSQLPKNHIQQALFVLRERKRIKMGGVKKPFYYQIIGMSNQ